MPFIAYQSADKLKDTTLATIKQAAAICREYEKQGFVLTLRQLYYQFVARGLIANKQTEYNNLGTAINTGRLCGLLDWNWIEDRTRNLDGNSHWTSPKQLLDAAVDQFAIDKWLDQPFRVEVWVEKEALVGVIERVCHEHDVPFFACRGYGSQSELWRAGIRFKHAKKRARQRGVVLHLGDHDPSGLDMTRDNAERLSMFAEYPIEIERLALNMDQVQQYTPPPNPAKVTDSRFNGYQAEFGDESWELDALEPRVIEDLVREAIERYRQDDYWEAAVEREENMRTRMRAATDVYRDD